MRQKGLYEMTEVFLLVGGAGFIGKNLLTAFVKNDMKTVVLDKSYPIGCEGLNFEFEKGDMGDENTLRAIIIRYKVTCLIHLVTTILPGTGVEELDKAILENISPLHNVLRVMAELSVEKIVFYSSGGTIYGLNGLEINQEDSPTNPINVYGWTKLASEQCIKMYCHLKGLQYKILRPSNAYGRGQNVFRPQGLVGVAMSRILRGEPVQVWGTGENVRDYIYIDDMNNGAVSAIQKGLWNRVYNLGSGEGHSINDVLSLLRLICGKKWDVVYTPARNVDIASNVLDITRLENECGWKPVINLEQGMKLTWDWIKKTQEDNPK